MNKVELSHNYNIVEISPANHTLVSMIHPLLSYDHRSMVFEGMGKPQRMVVERKNLYDYDDERETLIVPQGLLPRITTLLKEEKIDYEYIDLRSKHLNPDFENLHKTFPDIKYRHKQDMILSLITVTDSGQIVAPTGYGKTFIISVICALYPDAKILVTTPGTDLVRDTVKRLKETYGNEVGQVGGGKCDETKRIIVSTYQSLHKVPNNRDIILVDEVHKAASPTLSAALTDKTLATKIFGFTASPVGRMDNAELVTESIMGPVVVQVTYSEAVSKGIVAPMKVVFCPVPQGVPSSNYKTKVARERNLYWRNDRRNKIIAQSIEHFTKEFKLRENAQILVLVDKVDHAQRLHKFLPDYKLVYSQPGKTTLDKMSAKERKQLMEDFQNEKVLRVISTSCWGTGVDFPALDMVVQATGSASEINTIQYAGRGTRTNSGLKPFGVVLDFNDVWDPWSRKRANERRKVYKNLGWEIFG
jgi:superfamily II DNA or RNA helicase